MLGNISAALQRYGSNVGLGMGSGSPNGTGTNMFASGMPAGALYGFSGAGAGGGYGAMVTPNYGTMAGSNTGSFGNLMQLLGLHAMLDGGYQAPSSQNPMPGTSQPTARNPSANKGVQQRVPYAPRATTQPLTPSYGNMNIQVLLGALQPQQRGGSAQIPRMVG